LQGKAHLKMSEQLLRFKCKFCVCYIPKSPKPPSPDSLTAGVLGTICDWAGIERDIPHLRVFLVITYKRKKTLGDF